MYRVIILFLVFLFTGTSFAQQLSCDELRRRAVIRGNIVNRSRDNIEKDLAAVMSELMILKQRYNQLYLTLQAKKDELKEKTIEKDEPNDESDEIED